MVPVIDAKPASLDDALDRLGATPLAGRTAVIAVGSNASPVVLRRKLSAAGMARPVVPMAPVTVHGLIAGLSAHVSRPGYVPAAPVQAPGATTSLWVTWLDGTQLAAVDRTEPTYVRRRLDPDVHPVVAADGAHLRDCSVYVARHGVLAEPDGAPLPLDHQPAVIGRLLALCGHLRRLAGPTPEHWVATARASAATRNHLRKTFATCGLRRPDRITVVPATASL